MNVTDALCTTEDHRDIRDAVRSICDAFDDEYWREKDRSAQFPHEFTRAIGRGGWLGIAMPTEFGGGGLGITEAAVMMQTIGSSAGTFAACSSVHLNIFGPHTIVVHGTDEQRRRWLPPLIENRERACFGVTEPDAGLDTTRLSTRAVREGDTYRVNGRKIWTSTAQEADKIILITRTTPLDECQRRTDGLTLFYTDLDRDRVEAQRIPKMGRAAVDSNALFIDDLIVPAEDRIGEEGKGFHYLLDSLNPERILNAAEAIGIGRRALAKAAAYAREREVFGRPIGKNQGIQHPLAESWAELYAAELMVLDAARRYDAKEPCGAQANAAKYFAADAAFRACDRAVRTHGGMGYAKEYDVERYFREAVVTRLAPVSREMVLCYLAERVLDLPKSY